MISTRALLFFTVLTSCAYGHKNIKRDQEKHDHSVGIVGGHAISIEQAPFMASILPYDSNRWCGGSIIHERFILTSAECALMASDFKVLVGSNNFYEGRKEYDVEKTIIHEKYSSETGDYDVAIMKLNNSLTFGPTVSRVLLKGNENNVKVKLGTMLNITGWGVKDPEYVLSDILRQTTVPVVSNKRCAKFHKSHQLTKRMMCTEAVEKGACLADEGGPLTWNNIQIGIISRQTGCGQFPTVYTKVVAVNRWIKKTMIKHHYKNENKKRNDSDS